MCINQGIVGCTPTNVPRHGKSLYKPYITWVFMFFFSSPRIPRLNPQLNTVNGAHAYRGGPHVPSGCPCASTATPKVQGFPPPCHPVLGQLSRELFCTRRVPQRLVARVGWLVGVFSWRWVSTKLVGWVKDGNAVVVVESVGISIPKNHTLNLYIPTLSTNCCVEFYLNRFPGKIFFIKTEIVH